MVNGCFHLNYQTKNAKVLKTLEMGKLPKLEKTFDKAKKNTKLW